MAGGRPKQDTGQALSRHVGVRFSAAERAQLDARAALAGVSVSDHVRAAALQLSAPRRSAASRATLAPVELAQLDRIGAELRAIGVNMNQIARALNFATSRPIGDDLRDGLAELAATRARLNAIFDRFLP